MSLKCANVPHYDARRCCQTCHDNKDTSIYRVMVRRNFIQVCCEAWKYAKKNRLITARDRLDSVRRDKVPLAEKNLSIVLNHEV